MNSEYTSIKHELVELHSTLSKLKTRLDAIEIMTDSTLSKVSAKLRAIKTDKNENVAEETKPFNTGIPFRL